MSANVLCKPFFVVLLAWFCSSLLAEAADSENSIQGIWFGETVGGQPVKKMLRTILIVTEVETLLITDNGVAALDASYGTRATPRPIDIKLNEATIQRGVFEETKDNRLILTLANPGADRPTGKSASTASGAPHSHYVFTRLHTFQGLDLLHKTLENPVTRKQISKTNYVFFQDPLPSDHPEYNLPTR